MSTRHGCQREAQNAEVAGESAFAALAEAARDRQPVSGWTHNFYRYPARFSPVFAAAAIKHFSRPGELVCDPYMGGGTAVVEAVAAGRRVVGNDLNSLATFITKVKITALSADEVRALRHWSEKQVPSFTYHRPIEELAPFIDEEKTKNLTLIRARFIKKAIAAALVTIAKLPTENSRDFAKCAVLRVAQWALDGRGRHTSLADFRSKLTLATAEMLLSISAFRTRIKKKNCGHATLVNRSAAELDHAAIFRDRMQRVSLVVTSPPYPGVHVLYHRWQVDGRRETPAPYWITGCNDGEGASFYNFGDRRQAAADTYFRTSLATLDSIRRILLPDAYMVQLVAFNRPEEQLDRYLDNMSATGFREVLPPQCIPGLLSGRIWREVPNRKWHAAAKGRTHSAREVVLVHRPI
jgi:hypothetical protein